VQQILTLLRLYTSRPGQVVTVTEGSHGLFTEALARAPLDLRMIHPVTSAQWRRQHKISGSKSDRSDAELLAEFGRVQPTVARRAPRTSAAADTVKVLARSYDDLRKRRHQLEMQLRALLLDYYPAAITAFPTLHRPIALVTLRQLPTPRSARQADGSTLIAALHAAGLHPSPPDVDRRLRILAQPTLTRRASVEAASGDATRLLIDVLASVNTAIDHCEQQLLTGFRRHRSGWIYSSFPGLNAVLGARLLGEIGDDLSRYPSARELCAFAGTAPVTRSSGVRTVTHRRLVCNRRLNHAIYQWTLPLIRISAVASELYERRRTHGDRHGTASRNLTNHYLHALHHCLTREQAYDEDIARQAWLRPRL
jgi:transposase